MFKINFTPAQKYFHRHACDACDKFLVCIVIILVFIVIVIVIVTFLGPVRQSGESLGKADAVMGVTHGRDDQTSCVR